jgi:hypothetical protein
MLLAAGRVRPLAVIACIAAAGNLAVALPFTPLLGLTGTALGITIPQLLTMPWFMRIALREFDVHLADLARGAWLPAFTSSAVLAAALVVLQSAIHPRSLITVLALAGGGLSAVFGSYWFVWFDRSERALVRGLLRR